MGITAGGAAEMLRAFQAHPAAGTAGNTAWRFTPGTVLFPEAVCPRCHAPMQSVQRIWRVDVRAKRLLGQLVLRRRRPDGRYVWVLKAEKFSHPHCNRDIGTICMGANTDPIAALFMGMHQPGAYYTRDDYWRRWLAKMFRHRCDAAAVDAAYSARPPGLRLS